MITRFLLRFLLTPFYGLGSTWGIPGVSAPSGTTKTSCSVRPAEGLSGAGDAETRTAVGTASLKELDKRCYDLLESNARLCLRMQELGLAYSSLARGIAADATKSSGPGHVRDRAE